jgi:hypothetical protein
MAYYDQQFGFIEIIDTNGNSWQRTITAHNKGFSAMLASE